MYCAGCEGQDTRLHSNILKLHTTFDTLFPLVACYVPDPIHGPLDCLLMSYFPPRHFVYSIINVSWIVDIDMVAAMLQGNDV